jgi:NAD(P)-dependent dehydrogenase (short-subunit alcohol dehydrogenase family)
MTNTQRTVLVTGATSGLGLACARVLAATPGLHLLLGARDVARGRALADELGPNTEVLPVDLASLASVHDAALGLRGRPLDAVVCNAGVHESDPPSFTVDGYETTFAVNHLAHQALVLKLSPSLSDRARVVVVSSGTHDPATLEGRYNPPGRVDVVALSKGLEGTHPLSPVRRYTTSKLCNLLFAFELDRRFRGAGRAVTVNAFDPGAVPGTALTRDWSPGLKLMVKSSWLLALFGMTVSTPRRAGQALARLVTDPSLEVVTGRYFQLERERKPSAQAQDAELARTLFDETLDLLNERAWQPGQRTGG